MTTPTVDRAGASLYAVAADVPRRNRRAADALLAGPGLAVGAGVLVVLLLLWAVLPAVVIALVLGALTVLALRRAAGSAVLSRLPAVSADEARHARLANVVDGLCAAAGVARPDLFIVDWPAPNALVAGPDRRRASLVVTTGLLDGLSRIQLEGVVAHELSHIRRDDVSLSAALAVTLAPIARVVPRMAVRLARRLTGDREARADMAAVGLTRYPPGLAGAIDHIVASDDSVPLVSAAVDHLWVVPPPGALFGPSDPGSTEERLQTLSEL
ncbi:MAG TPA: M48 family metalloprotease [Acidimicrobiales bacterium]|nr:M48 family metalloprotease [Acidimicrobiales bacterium]